jgi:hypothetical protein
MSEKPKMNPSETFVLDNDMIDELDELSLTSVIRDFEVSSDEDAVKPKQERPDQHKADSDSDDGDGEFVLTLLDD